MLRPLYLRRSPVQALMTTLVSHASKLLVMLGCQSYRLTPELQRLKPGANVAVPATPAAVVATMEGLGHAMGLRLA